MSMPQHGSVPASLQNVLSLLDSITDVAETDAGKIVLSGSHGGLYPAAIASRAKVRAVVFNDAGTGLQRAGVKGVEALAGVGMAAATVDCMSAKIGSTEDMLAAGVISYINDRAAEAGLSIGMKVIDALMLLVEATPPTEQLPPVPEARWEHAGATTGTELDTDTRTRIAASTSLSILCVDSASLVKSDDAGRIIVTGSHGGLIGGDPARALKAKAKLAVFNDAGVGKDKIGLSRLPALNAIGVAAVTVSNQSAIIGSAQSCIDTGVISFTNDLAERLGLNVGDALASALSKLQETVSS